MQLACPCCHARFALEAAIQDEAAREIAARFVAAGPAFGPLVTYLGFFRPKTRALAWDRALRLATEVLGLAADREVLAAALAETCASLEVKRNDAGWKPLTGHNYLKRVLESVSKRVDARGALDVERPPLPQSRTGQALQVLEGRKHGR